MDFSSVQQDHVSALWTRVKLLVPDGENWTRPHAEKVVIKRSQRNPSALLATYGLACLNLPLFVLYHLDKARATRRAYAAIEEGPLLKFVTGLLPFLKDALAKTRVTQDVSGPYLMRYAISPDKGRWWTVFSSTFLHTSPWHLAANMAGLLLLSDSATRVPGMNAGHMLALTSCTSAIIGGVALLSPKLLPSGPRLPLRNWRSCGFSGVLCAIASVAAIASPEKGTPAWMLEFAHLLLEYKYGEVKVDGGIVDHSTHLVGNICGFLYWSFFLRRPKVVEVDTDTSADNAAADRSGMSAKASVEPPAKAEDGSEGSDTAVYTPAESSPDLTKSVEELMDWDTLMSRAELPQTRTHENHEEAEGVTNELPSIASGADSSRAFAAPRSSSETASA